MTRLCAADRLPSEMALKKLGLLELFGVWSIFFIIVLGLAVCLAATEDLKTIAKDLAAVVGAAPFPAALFAVIMWGIIKLV
jgi:formate/nitrite transporter FocA (FNT family)